MTASDYNPTIDQVIKALEESEAAIRTLDHHLRAAAVYGLEALGLDEHGRLRFDRFKEDGVAVVAEAANKYLNDVLAERFNYAAGIPVNPSKFAPDELSRLQGGYFGISSQDVTLAVRKLKEKFTPEALVEMYKGQIRVAKEQINKAPLSLAEKLDTDEVLEYVGLKGSSNPLSKRIAREKIEAPHLLALLDEYRLEKTIPESFLDKIGI